LKASATMADENLDFDLSIKKKKSKKVEFNADGSVVSPDGTVEASGDKAVDNLAGTLDEFSLTKKKKKTKKKGFNLDDPEGGNEAEPEVDVDAGPSADPEVEGAADDDIDFNLTKKKKKKKITFGEDENLGDEPADEVALDDASPSSATGGATPWANSDRDYTYEELLNHVFNIIKEKNPDMIAGERRRLVMRPPQVLRVGTKKSSFANFLEICKSLHRQPKHMQAFLLAELGTSGSVDANNQLIIKGRFQQKQIESVLRRYIKEYVACQTCRSPETILQKDTRLFFLQCETCGSRRSVASIKSGFQAVTGKRAAMRAKTA